MDLRRLLNIAYADLVRDVPADKIAGIVERLRSKFDGEMTPEERRMAEYRRKAEEVGAITGQQTLMDAFKMPTTGPVTR